jgi:hypothetical protein
MAAQTEMLGVGSLLYYNTADATGTLISSAATGTYGGLAYLMDVSIPETATADIETTLLGNTDLIKRFKPGFKDNGTLDVELQYHDANEVLLRALEGRLCWYKALNPDGSGDAFQGYINKLGGKREREALILRNVTIKVSGPLYRVAAP